MKTPLKLRKRVSTLKKRPFLPLMLTLAFPLACSAGTISQGNTFPTIGVDDLYNNAEPSSAAKWWTENSLAGTTKGQSFTTGPLELELKSLTYKLYQENSAQPTKQYYARVGKIVGDTFEEVYGEWFVQTSAFDPGNYVTWNFENPPLLEPNTLYGVDVGLASSTSSWQTGIPYIETSVDTFSGGTLYRSGTSGVGDDTVTVVSNSDYVFHIDFQALYNPQPTLGSVVNAGQVDLSWSNIPNGGNDVWIDLWYGTDPTSLTKVVSAPVNGLNTESFTVLAPEAGEYYWRVDSYLNGNATELTNQSSLFSFIVIDTDGDGIPDEYELANTTPASPIAFNPDDDLENNGAGDGLTNLEEYQQGTDPFNEDTDGDTLSDSLEVSGDGVRPATNPLNADSDGDGIRDDYEGNTGIWVSATETGTNPTDKDTDKDGLEDLVETNTGVFTNALDTGTSPHLADTDGDNAGDWYEVEGSLTSPLDQNEKPNIPYPLPKHDGQAGSSNKPVKVYILSGQSNMVGFGRTEGDIPGTLTTMTKENKFPNVIDDQGNWIPLNDVSYRGVISAIGNGAMLPEYGARSSSFGPEYGIGHVLGWYHDEPVLIIKSSVGNRSLGWDCLPSQSVRYDYNGYTYAGYGDSPDKWPIGTTPTPVSWYAGKQYDDYFLDEADHAPAGGANVFNVVDVLDNFASEYPQYAAQGFEISGYVWWQGHKDQGEPNASNYGKNMETFIKSLRSYYEGRYASTVKDAPFVLGTIAFNGWNLSGLGATVAQGQLSVSGETGNIPEFANNVKTIEARPYWRDYGPNTNQGYHYNHNAETYMLVGDALGRAMVDLQNLRVDPDYEVWQNKFPGQDLTDPTADINGNGYSNNQDRIWGFDPILTKAGQVIDFPTLDSENAFTYTRRLKSLTGYDFEVLSSDDLSQWSVDTAATQSVISTANEVETVKVTFTGVTSKKFFKVRAF